MKDKFEHFFDENKELFKADFELSKGHEDRFLAKLKQNKKANKKNITWLKVAAVILPLILVGGFLIHQNQNNQTASQAIELASYSPELSQANDYFNYTVNQKVKEVEALKNDTNKEMIDFSLNELKNLERNYAQLLLDLKESNGNPQVIQSILTNLQLRVTVLESLMDQLKIKNQLKNNSHENTL